MYGPPEREPADGRVTRSSDQFGAYRYRIAPLIMRAPGAAAILALGGSPVQETQDLTPTQQTGARAESATNFTNLRYQAGSGFQLNYQGFPVGNLSYPLGLSRPSRWLSAPILKEPTLPVSVYGSS